MAQCVSRDLRDACDAAQRATQVVRHAAVEALEAVHHLPQFSRAGRDPQFE